MREGKYESGSNVGTAITFLLIGLGAGAVVGMLFAPKAGRQMRRDLRRGYDNARETLDDWKDTARDFAVGPRQARESAEQVVKQQVVHVQQHDAVRKGEKLLP